MLYLIEKGAVEQDKGRVETQMILNHKATIELLMNLHAALAYVAIRQNLAEHDPLRLRHRSLVKDTVRAEVLQPQAVVDGVLSTDLPDAEHEALRALILDELHRLNESVLARYGLRPSKRKAWQQAQGL